VEIRRVGAAARQAAGLAQGSRELDGAASHRAYRVRPTANKALGAWPEKAATDRRSSRASQARTLEQATSSEDLTDHATPEGYQPWGLTVAPS
jgi:hypothetical protein